MVNPKDIAGNAEEEEEEELQGDVWVHLIRAPVHK